MSVYADEVRLYEKKLIERGGSAVECLTRNGETPGSNPPFATFRNLGIFVISTTPQLQRR